MLENQPSQSELQLPSLCANGAAALWWPWPVISCVCVTSWPAAWLCSCPAPHHRADALRKTTEMLWRSSKWHESWLLFVLLHCSSCCVYPWGRLRATIPISQTCHFQSVFQGTDRLNSVFLSMGALWGGCDDASGSVLVWVMTNGF